MSISVLCDECGKTYQVRDEMAGRKGKCPKGHSVLVPASSETIVEDNDFSFISDSKFDPPSSHKSQVRRAAAATPADDDFGFSNDNLPANAEEEEPAPKPKAKRSAKAAPAAVAEPEDDFGFPSTGPVAERSERAEPSSSKHKKVPAQKERPTREKAAGKSMIPMLVGAGIGLLGFGVGIGLFFMGRAETNPLREQVAAAEKKAADADLKTSTAEAKVKEEQEKAKKSPAFNSKDPNLIAAQSRVSAAEKKVAELEKKLAAVGEAPAVPKKDEAMAANPEMPKAKAPIPKGKTWSAPPTVLLDQVELKAGSLLTLTPSVDAAIKPVKGLMKVKVKFALQPGKQLPKEMFISVFILQAGGEVAIRNVPATMLKGPNGEAEISVDVRTITGNAEIVVCFSDNKTADGAKNLVVYSSLLKLMGEF